MGAMSPSRNGHLAVEVVEAVRRARGLPNKGLKLKRSGKGRRREAEQR